MALVRVGYQTIPSADARGLSAPVAKAVKASVESRLKLALAQGGYPEKADPKHWQSLFNQVVVYSFDLRQHDQADAALRRLEAVNPEAPGLAKLKQALEQAKGQS